MLSKVLDKKALLNAIERIPSGKVNAWLGAANLRPFSSGDSDKNPEKRYDAKSFNIASAQLIKEGEDKRKYKKILSKQNPELGSNETKKRADLLVRTEDKARDIYQNQKRDNKIQGLSQRLDIQNSVIGDIIERLGGSSVKKSNEKFGVLIRRVDKNEKNQELISRIVMRSEGSLAMMGAKMDSMAKTIDAQGKIINSILQTVSAPQKPATNNPLLETESPHSSLTTDSIKVQNIQKILSGLYNKSLFKKTNNSFVEKTKKNPNGKTRS